MNGRHILFLLLIQGNPTLAQGDWVPCQRQELQAAMERYEKALMADDSWQLHMEMTSYPDAEGPEADRGRVAIVRAGAYMRADHMGMITYQDRRLSAVADAEEKVVVVSENKPFLDLATNQRVEMLATAASQILKQSSPAGTTYRIIFAGTDGPYSYVEVGYDGKGYLTRLVLQWKPTTAGAASGPMARMYTPRVVMTITPPADPDQAQIREATSGLDSRLRTDGDRLKTIGPWAGYRIVDTRFRP
jgi:hypothetical protein